MTTRHTTAARALLAALGSLFAATAHAETLNVHNGGLFYETRGDGPALILLHDGLMDRQSWDAQWNSPPHGFRLVRYDRRGYGKSPEPTGPFSDVEDLAALMDELSIQRAALVGCSTGGKVAIEFTLVHPDRVERLVLEGAVVSGMPFSEHFTRRNRAAFRPLVEAGDVAATIANWQKDPYLLAARNDAARRRLGEL